MDTEIEVFNLIRSSTRALTDEQIIYDAHGIAEQDVRAALRTLMKESLIQRAKGDRWRINPRSSKVIGKIQTKRQGYGFLILPAKDYFVAANNLRGSLEGDIVIAKLKTRKKGPREEAEVVKILRRSKQEIIGRFQYENSIPVVAPSDKRVPFVIEIPRNLIGDAQEGNIVVAKISEYPGKTGAIPKGDITEILGNEHDPNIEIEIIIREHGLKQTFPGDVIDEVRRVAVPPTAEDLVGREDIRNDLIVTIDGENAKDFDDAVFAKKTGKGYMLRVAIADVSHYVRPFNKIFQEAEERGTSVYLVDRVIPMLPQELSNEICSLKPNEDRLCLVVDIFFNNNVDIKDYKIFPAVMNSNARLTYEAVDEFFDSGKSNFDKEVEDMLRVLKELSQKLEKSRLDRGSLEFESAEPYIKMEDGVPTDIVLVTETASRKLIEESMISANEVIAGYLKEQADSGVYRIHQEPDFEVLRQLSAILETLGHKDMPEAPTSRDLQKVIEFAKERPEKLLINTLLLRSMQQARYSTNAIGHFGLASENYTHFTSPIRRFPDLIVHTLVKHLIGFQDLGEGLYHLYMHLAAICEQSSITERAAVDAERESTDVKVCEYMSDKVGEIFPGIISGMLAYGMFVELENTAEGLIHISDLTDDYYQHDPKKLTMFGVKSGKTFKLGQQLKVKLKKVRIGERKLDFELSDDGQE